MRHYYRIDIHSQARPLDDTEAKWEGFDDKSHTFDSLDEVKAFLTDQYAGQPNEPIYADSASGLCHIVGVIYFFESCDWSHYPVESWAQCDWVSVVDVVEMTVAPSTLGVVFADIVTKVTAGVEWRL